MEQKNPILRTKRSDTPAGHEAPVPQRKRTFSRVNSLFRCSTLGETMDKETDVEQYLTDEVKKRGGLSYKFTSPGQIGVPDRIIILNGKTAFVELKRPKGGRFSKLQKWQIEQMRQAGALVYTAKNKEEVNRIMEEMEK